jgi:uncharacterized protein
MIATSKLQQKHHLKVISRIVLYLCISASLYSQTKIPVITDPVSDLTNTLDQSEVQNLRNQILYFEDSTSNQLVVLMIPTLGDNEIRDFGITTLQQNKIGQKGKDNGVLLLIAKEDHQVSIEVGYGLEGVLTDALCSDIIRNEVRPRFRQDDYYGGISAAIQSIMLATKGEYTGGKKDRNRSVNFFPIIVIFFIIISFVMSFGRSRRTQVGSRGSNNIWWGGGMGGGGGNWGSFGGGGGGGGWSAGGGSFGGGGASGSW